MGVMLPAWPPSPWLPAMALLLALAVDRWLGEPPARWHPVVWMGHWLGWAGARIAPLASAPTASAAAEARSFLGGMLAWLLGASAVLALAIACQAAVLWLVWQGQWALAALLLGLALKPLLAWRMLHDEVQAVEAALATSLAAGRERLAWLVSRDVAALNDTQVRESAIESLAENLNDSVVAPIFWFVLLGLPGAALYRFANTADAMWGYRGVRQGRVWEWAGKWAARADDLLSWLPARLAALLLMLAGAVRADGWRVLRREAAITPSPNSGWPMAAMALALDVRLGKPGVYTLNSTGRPPQAQDMAQALACARYAVLALLPLACALLWGMALWAQAGGHP